MSAFPPARRAITAAVLALALLSPLGAPAHATDAPTTATAVLGDCQHRLVEPHRIIVACGDGSLLVRVRRWQSWGTGQAFGLGAIWADDCDPTCADGTYHRTPGRVRLFRPVPGQRGPVFSRVAVRYVTGGRPGRDVYALTTSATP